MHKPFLRLTTAWMLLYVVNIATGQSLTIKTAVAALRKVRPETTWKVDSAKVADVDCDSKPDAIILGSEKHTVMVGVVWGATNKTPQIFSFPIRRGAQDGFCSAPTKIETSPLDCQSEQGSLPGCKVTNGCREFSLDDDDCDRFHFYWDGAQKQLAWWRL